MPLQPSTQAPSLPFSCTQAGFVTSQRLALSSDILAYCLHLQVSYAGLHICDSHCLIRSYHSLQSLFPSSPVRSQADLIMDVQYRFLHIVILPFLSFVSPYLLFCFCFSIFFCVCHLSAFLCLSLFLYLSLLFDAGFIPMIVHFSLSFMGLMCLPLLVDWFSCFKMNFHVWIDGYIFIIFQGDKNAGFAVLYHNMKHGQLSIKELAEFVRER